MNRIRRPAAWWPELLLLAAFVAITLALVAGHLLRLDVVVRDWSDQHRPPVLYWTARVLNYAGEGGKIATGCALFAVWLGWQRHTVRPIVPVIAAFLLTSVAIGPLKLITNRPPPHNGAPHPERFGVGGLSYPSGHLVNALVWYQIVVLLLAPWLPLVWRRVIRIAPPVVLTVTTVYLGWHWFTDTVAGLLLGFVLDRLLRRVDWDRVPLGRRLTATGWAGPGLPGPVDAEPVAEALPRG